MRRLRSISGRRFGVVFCAGLTGMVFLLNVAITIWAVKTSKNWNGSVGIIRDGDCRHTKKLSLWLHFAINVFSTLLLGASNYCMQCLSSLTRQDIDKAHAQKHWLDIGVSSIRNLRRISWKRIVLWWLLAITSLPLHLLYNSVIFDTLAFQEYNAYTVSKDFESGAPYDINIPSFYSSWGSSRYFLAEFALADLESVLALDIKSRLDALRESTPKKTLKKIEKEDCMREYGAGFTPKYKDILAVSAASNATNPLLNFFAGIGPPTPGSSFSPLFANWEEVFCVSVNKGDCEAFVAAQVAQTWEVASFSIHSSIEYCLCQEKTKDRCMLQFSLPFMLVVIIGTLVKLTCMVLIVVMRKESSRSLKTLGDAIASFLNEPDSFTKDICLADRRFFRDGGWEAKMMTWESEPHRWFRGASGTRWLVSNVLWVICLPFFAKTGDLVVATWPRLTKQLHRCIITLCIAVVLLRMGLKNNNLSDKSISHLWKLGYGAVNGETLIEVPLPGDNRGIMASVLLSNSPQLILSFLYVTYNGLFTCMLLVDEWNGFAHERKPLRVTSPSPTGKQRSSYWLSLPYKYAIPLLVISGTLHWLVSQSIFLARVLVFDYKNEEKTSESIYTVGYSPIALITVIMLGSIAVIFGIWTGSRKYQTGMPLAGSCSAAISAACYRLSNDPDVALLPVMWGAVESKDEDTIGHCCFSSLDVSPPIEGDVYG